MGAQPKDPNLGRYHVVLKREDVDFIKAEWGGSDGLELSHILRRLIAQFVKDYKKTQAAAAIAASLPAAGEAIPQLPLPLPPVAKLG